MRQNLYFVDWLRGSFAKSILKLTNAAIYYAYPDRHGRHSGRHYDHGECRHHHGVRRQRSIGESHRRAVRRRPDDGRLRYPKRVTPRRRQLSADASGSTRRDACSLRPACRRHAALREAGAFFTRTMTCYETKQKRNGSLRSHFFTPYQKIRM